MDEESIKESGSSTGSSSDRRNFLRGAASLVVANMALGCGLAYGVGVQPGERTTPPPNPLLLIPALRAKVTSFFVNICLRIAID